MAQHSLGFIQMLGVDGFKAERTVVGTKPMSGYFDITVNLHDGEYNVTGLCWYFTNLMLK